EGTRRYGVATDPVPSPLDGKRARHGEHAPLGGCRWYHIGRASKCISRDDIEDAGGLLGCNPVLAKGQCAVGRTFQYDINHGSERVGRQALGGRNKVPRRVIHQCVDLSEGGQRRIAHGFYLLVMPHVAGDGGYLAARLRLQFLGGGLDYVRFAACNEYPRAQLQEIPAHFLAQARSTARHDDGLALQGTLAKRSFGWFCPVAHILRFYCPVISSGSSFR